MSIDGWLEVFFGRLIHMALLILWYSLIILRSQASIWIESGNTQLILMMHISVKFRGIMLYFIDFYFLLFCIYFGWVITITSSFILLFIIFNISIGINSMHTTKLHLWCWTNTLIMLADIESVRFGGVHIVNIMFIDLMSYTKVLFSLVGSNLQTHELVWVQSRMAFVVHLLLSFCLGSNSCGIDSARDATHGCRLRLL